MQFSRERVKIIGLHIVILLSVLKFLLVPLYQEQMKMKEEFNKKLQKLKVMAVLNNTYPSKSFEDLKSKIFSGEDIFLIQGKMIGLVEELSRKYTLNLIHYELLEPKEISNFLEIPLNLKLEGEIFEFLKFLRELKKYPKFIEVKGLEIIKVENKFQYNLLISVYKN